MERLHRSGTSQASFTRLAALPRPQAARLVVRNSSLLSASELKGFSHCVLRCCPQAAVTRVASLPGGRLLASADEDGLLVVMDVRSLGAGPGGEFQDMAC